MEESFPEFSLAQKVPTFFNTTFSTDSFTVSDKDNSGTNMYMSEEISMDATSKISSAYNFLAKEVLIYSSIIPESSRRNDNDKEKEEKKTEQEKKEENGKKKEEEKEEREEESTEKDEETEGENVDEKEKSEEKRDSSTSKKSSKKRLLNFFFRKNKQSQKEDDGVRLKTNGDTEETHTEEEHVEEKHVEVEHEEKHEEKHVEDKHVEGEHDEEKHVEDKHVEAEHDEEKHVVENHEEKDVEGEHVEGEHVEEKYDKEDHINGRTDEERTQGQREEEKYMAERYSEYTENSDEDSDGSVERSAGRSRGYSIQSEAEGEPITEREASIVDEYNSHEEDDKVDHHVDDMTVISTVLRLQKKEPDDVSFLPVPQAVRRDRLKLYFRRGFRPDNINLDGRVAFIPSHGAAPPDSKSLDEETKDDDSEMEKFQPVVYLSENEEPIDFLISLGFHIDEAALAIKEDEVKQRLRAALVEAKIWVKYLTVMEGTLILLLCQQITSTSMRFFLHMVEAIVNNRITSAYQIDAVFRALEKVDMGTIQQVHESESIQRLEIGTQETDKKQIRTRFFQLYGIANEEAECKQNLRIGKQATRLIEYLCVKYHPALRNHVDLIARYIGLGILRTRVQLNAAMLFCLRAANKEIDIDEFELFCGFDEEHFEGPTSDDDWWESKWSESYTAERTNDSLGSRSDTRTQNDTENTIRAMPLVFDPGLGPFASFTKSDGAIIKSSNLLSKHVGFHNMRPSSDPEYRSNDFEAGPSDLSLGEDSASLRRRRKELWIHSGSMKLDSLAESAQDGSSLQRKTRASSKGTSDRMFDAKSNASIEDMKSQKLSDVIEPNTLEDNLFTAKHFLWSSESDRISHSSDYSEYHVGKNEQKVRGVVSKITHSYNRSTGSGSPPSEIWSQDIPDYENVDSSSKVFSHKLNPETSSYTIISDGGTFSHVRDSVTQTSLDNIYSDTDSPLSRTIKDKQSVDTSEGEHSWMTTSDDASLSKYSEISPHEPVPTIKGNGTPTSECTLFSGTTRSSTDTRTNTNVSESPSTSWPFLSGNTRRASERVPPPEDNSEPISNSFSNISDSRVSETPRSDYCESISDVRSSSKRTKPSKSDVTSIRGKKSPRNNKFHTSSSNASDHRSNENTQNRRAENKIKNAQSLSNDSRKGKRHQHSLEKLRNELYVCDDDGVSISNITFQISGDDVNSERDLSRRNARVYRTTNSREFDRRSFEIKYPKHNSRQHSDELIDSRSTSISDFDFKTIERSAIINDATQRRDNLRESRIITNSDFDSSTNDNNGPDNDARKNGDGLTESKAIVNSNFHLKTLNKSDLINHSSQHVDTPMGSKITIASDFDCRPNGGNIIHDARQHAGELRDSRTTPRRDFYRHTEDSNYINDARQQSDDLTESETVVGSEFDRLSSDRSYLINNVRQHSEGADVNVSDRTYSIEFDSRTDVLTSSNDNQIQNTRAATNHGRDITELSSDSEYHSAHDMIERNKYV